MFSAATLEHLDLSHNPIEALPLEIGNLELLKETNIWDVGVGLLVKLKKLEMSHCLLFDWIMQLDRIAGLEHLDVSHNKLTTVPGMNIKQNTALTYLDVSHNKLKMLPAEIYQLPLQVGRRRGCYVVRLTIDDHVLPSLSLCSLCSLSLSALLSSAFLMFLSPFVIYVLFVRF